MDGTVWLLGCSLLLAQAPDRQEWQLTPRLGRGHELLYRGSFDEEVTGRGTRFKRTYRTETRVFILETPAQGYDVAFLTLVKGQSAGVDKQDAPPPTAVRLELARVDLQGRITPGFPPPLDGPPTIDCGAFVEVPQGRVVAGKPWDVTEPGRPARTWKLGGTEVVQGARCLRLEGIQQSEDWDRPRADRTAWRRRDVVWVNPRQGIAHRVERIIEQREPAREEPSQRSVARYDLESMLQYPGQLFEDRKREILAARAFHESIGPLLPDPGRHGPKPFETVLTKITNHLDSQPPTPYRDAVVQVRRRVEAARRGEVPATLASGGPRAAVGPAEIGQPAPDFVTINLLTRESARLRRYLGKPLLMLFYSPSAASADDLLRYAQGIGDRHRGTINVLAFAMSDDSIRARKQHVELRLTYPILSGTGLRLTYGVRETPTLVVLDAQGVLRASYVGWGSETPQAIAEELKRAFPR
jgi:hypothetical protein